MKVLDERLRQGTVPTHAELSDWVDQEWPKLNEPYDEPKRPDMILLAVALALLNDPKRWQKLIVEDYFRQKFSYRRQKEGGMPEYELGPEPSEYVSAMRLRRSVSGYFKWGATDVPETLVRQVRDRLASFEPKPLPGASLDP